MKIDGTIEESGRFRGSISFAFAGGIPKSFVTPVLKSSISSFRRMPVDGEITLLPKLLKEDNEKVNFTDQKRAKNDLLEIDRRSDGHSISVPVQH